MKKCLPVLALLCAATSAQGQVEPSRHFSEAYQRKALEAVVRIRIRHAHGARQGSGVSVRYADGESYILTCAHLLKDVESSEQVVIEVFTRASYPNPAHTYRARKVRWWRDRKADLALIVAPVFTAASVKICRPGTRVVVGTRVLGVGCGLGAPPVCQVGAVTGRDRLKDYVIGRGGIGGRSGGAVLSAGGLIGIHVRGANDRTVAVNYGKIHRFLRSTGHDWLLPD